MKPLSSLVSSLAGALLAAAAFGSGLANVAPVIAPPICSRRRAKSRGNGRMQRQRWGNKPGRYSPHQGAKEMARRVRHIAEGRYTKEQLA